MEITIQNEVSMYARTATPFVKEAAEPASTIIIENLTSSSLPAEARSLLKIFYLEVEQGPTIRITPDGPDETDAYDVIKL